MSEKNVYSKYTNLIRYKTPMSLAFDDKNHLSKNRLIPDLLTCKLRIIHIR